MSNLTDRQIEVGRLVAEGRSYKAVGRALGLSPRRVEEHVHNTARIVREIVPDLPASRPRDVVTIFFLSIHDKAA